MVWKGFTFEPAGTAEVLRTAQRDDVMVERIQQQASDLLLKVAGNRIWMKHRTSVQVLSKMLYTAFTTLSDVQTLGEEYTGIVQVDRELKQLPSKQLRLLSLLLECFGGVVLDRILSVLQSRLRAPSSLTIEARACLLEAIGAFKSFAAFISRLHRAFFYWGGSYYLVAKRITGIRYALVRRWLKDRTTPQGFKVLSVVTLLQLLMYTLAMSTRWVQTLPITLPRLQNSLQNTNDAVTTTRDITENNSGIVYYRCALCLETRANDTATPCGHIFCWNCISEWLQTRSQCPLCREFVEVTRLIPIQNLLKHQIL